MRINPLRDLVLVRCNAPLGATPGGLIIPELAGIRQELGTVVAVGPGLRKGGCLQPVWVKPGEHVLFCPYAGTDVTINGETCIILHQSDILAVIKESI